MKIKSLGTFSRESIERVRSKFFEEYTLDKSLFDAEDVKRVKEDPWFIIRFLFIQKSDEDLAAKNLTEAMKWRHQKGLRTFPENYFPNEFYRVGAMFPYEPDIQGAPVLYIRCKFMKKINIIQSAVEDFCAYQIYKMDEESHGDGWSLVMDFEGAGIQNADVESTKYLVSTLKTYFPGGLNHLLCIDCPWILKTFWSLIKGWIPNHRRDLIKFTSRKEITKYIAVENLPDFLGGTCKRKYKGWAMVPEGCPHGVDFIEAINQGVNTRDDVEAVFSEYREFLDDADQGPQFIDANTD